MEFNSQICTTKIQSERLLALGLKKETADMEIHEFFDDDKEIFEIGFANQGYMEPEMEETVICSPAWSLSRLLSMMPSFIDIGGYEYMLRIIQGRAFSYRSNIVGEALLYGCGSVYDSAIYTIEWLIGEGCFNKEYLEE